MYYRYWHQFVTLASILQEFKNTHKKILMEYGSIILLFLFVWWYVFYRQHSGKMTETELAKQQELKKLSLILEADFGLLLRLQEFSGQLFIHSMTISSVSAQAARHMGGNVLLAQAGGLYHEIGRITGDSNYIDAGVKLAEEYDFPRIDRYYQATQYAA